ncbi:acyl-CoA dehydrogenase family protein [Sphingobium sp. V4]|uniref:acyl-CoA dehydrogenase family protein n=1 Tax=Sphingobium sp. V4 TaxID=3038927 RepID=UPI0025582289|nr:acyl-CoA dehydrogenase family protein [Sphingobium sp. V4]WIW89482.1 acyl-CoA dehydrogenase family protein [Sphingobium sp. V4]
MDLRYSSEQEQVREAAKVVFSDHVSHEARLTAEQSDDGFDKALWQEIIKLEWLSAASNEDDLETLAILAEEAGRSAVALPLLATVAAILLLQDAADGEALEEIRRSIETGERIVVPLPNCRSRQSGENLSLTSPDQLVLWGAQTDAFLVPAISEAGVITISLVEAGTPGAHIREASLIDNLRGAWISLEDVVPTKLISTAMTEEVLERWREKCLLLGAAEAYGAAEGAIALTTNYVKERFQFGRAIGSFQAVQHGLANAKAYSESAWLAVWEGVSGIAHGEQIPSAGALAAWLAERALQEAAVAGSQFHGGMGITREYPMQHYYRRAAAAHGRLGSQYDLLGKIADRFVDHAPTDARSAFSGDM